MSTMKEDYEKTEGVKALSDEEFEKVKQKAESTRKERLGEMYKGTSEEYELMLAKRRQRLEEFSNTPVRPNPYERPYGSGAIFYHRITIPLEKVKAFFGFGKK
jgi:histidinol dehydrogenase